MSSETRHLQLRCPECGEVGLSVASAANDQMDWPGPKPCAACGRPISQARLQALPGTTLCTACQQGEERGQSQGETEYCPRCGAPMELRLAKTGGLTRYVSVCTAKSACRPKS